MVDLAAKHVCKVLFGRVLWRDWERLLMLLLLLWRLVVVFVKVGSVLVSAVALVVVVGVGRHGNTMGLVVGFHVRFS